MPEIQVAHTAEELRRLLRQQGMAAATEVSLVEGMDGGQDAAIMFPDRANTSVFGVGFSSGKIPIDTAHQAISEISPTLVRQPPHKVRSCTATFYYEQR